MNLYTSKNVFTSEKLLILNERNEYLLQIRDSKKILKINNARICFHNTNSKKNHDVNYFTLIKIL